MSAINKRFLIDTFLKWNFQPSDNSSNEEDNLAAKQVMVCFSEDVSLKMRNQKMWQSAISKLESYGYCMKNYAFHYTYHFSYNTSQSYSRSGIFINIFYL